MGHRCPYCWTLNVRFKRVLGPAEDPLLDGVTVRQLAPDGRVVEGSCWFCGNLSYFVVRDDQVCMLNKPEETPAWCAVLALTIGVGLYIVIACCFWRFCC